jgi:integrase
MTQEQKEELGLLVVGRGKIENDEPAIRGAIDDAKLVQLLKFVESDKTSTAADRQRDAWYLYLTQRLALRSNQMNMLKTSGFTCDTTKKTWMLTLEKQHDPLGARTVKRAERETAPVPADLNARLEAHFKKLETCGETRVAPEWNDDRLRTHIQRCATANSWDANLQWCVHSLRHGAATPDLARTGSISKVQSLLRHSSEATSRMYSESNSSRSKRAAQKARRARGAQKGGSAAATKKTKN